MAQGKKGSRRAKAPRKATQAPRHVTKGKTPAAPTAKKQVLPRIGFESVALRAAQMWRDSPTDIAAPNLLPDQMITPVQQSEKLRPIEEAQRKASDKAFNLYTDTHAERMVHVIEGAEAFRQFCDFLKPAAKHNEAVARKYDYVIEFVNAPAKVAVATRKANKLARQAGDKTVK